MSSVSTSTNALYRVTYARTNFNFDPPLKQTADVVFYSDKALEEGNPYHSPVAADMQAAAKEQLAMWREHTEFPVEGWGGWSSVLPDGRITRVDDPLEGFELGTPGDSPIPRIAECFTYQGGSYRVTSFYKRYVRMADACPEREAEYQRLAALISEEAQNSGKVQLVRCARDEAEYVEGAGVAGCIAKVHAIKVTGVVAWDLRSIARARLDYRCGPEFEEPFWR